MKVSNEKASFQEYVARKYGQRDSEDASRWHLAENEYSAKLTGYELSDWTKLKEEFDSVTKLNDLALTLFNETTPMPKALFWDFAVSPFSKLHPSMPGKCRRYESVLDLLASYPHHSRFPRRIPKASGLQRKSRNSAVL
eukprot:4384254-Prymnesium_polylepis.2